jgi:uncharacterized protein YbjT (DUF2867 family)
MQKVLIVGATGQLGATVVEKLVARRAEVRALVRTEAGVRRFAQLGVDTVLGDLTDPASLAAACRGITTVVTTANAAVPTRKSDTFQAVERDGYRNLIHAAVNAKVRRFVYTSVPLSKCETLAPLIRYKRETEKRVFASGLDHVVFRADIFMDIAFSMMGSDIPVRGVESPTVTRSFAFSSRHFQKIRRGIERDHTAMIPGDGSTRHAFICIDDMAAFLASAALSDRSGTFNAGGPEALTFLDVVKIYERILNVSLKVNTTPATVFRVMSTVLRPFSPAASNLMGLNYIAAREESSVDLGPAALFDVQLTSAESFLRARIGMAARASGSHE